MSDQLPCKWYQKYIFIAFLGEEYTGITLSHYRVIIDADVHVLIYRYKVLLLQNHVYTEIADTLQIPITTNVGQ